MPKEVRRGSGAVENFMLHAMRVIITNSIKICLPSLAMLCLQTFARRVCSHKR